MHKEMICYSLDIAIIFYIGFHGLIKVTIILTVKVQNGIDDLAAIVQKPFLSETGKKDLIDSQLVKNSFVLIVELSILLGTDTFHHCISEGFCVIFDLTDTDPVIFCFHKKTFFYERHALLHFFG